jgi:peptidoglycan/xylan/chitin deacetylase (PgdA/CDA1 family)
MAVAGTIGYSMALQYDLVQRISRRRAWKTRVESVFRGWDHMLLNAMAGFATRNGVREIRIPRSPFALLHTDRKRSVKPELFERVYDRAVHRQFRVRELPEWWSIRLSQNRKKVALANRVAVTRALPRVVCICHDIERGLGHRKVDPAFADQAEQRAPVALTHMLAIEAAAGVRATYNVVGTLLEQVRPAIAAGGHCVGFHSYDHDLDREQLERCRQVDYRLKGYRAPRSTLTNELTPERLGWHNFEWFASSRSSLGFDRPRLQDRLVTIPIALDDFSLYRGEMSFETWADRVLELVRQSHFLAIGLHDCYADHWLTGYPRFLEDLGRLAAFRTLDQVAAELHLAGGI